MVSGLEYISLVGIISCIFVCGEVSPWVSSRTCNNHVFLPGRDCVSIWVEFELILYYGSVWWNLSC